MTDESTGAAGTGAPQAPPPPPPSGTPQRPPLRRPREGRVLAGLAAGLARHLGVDVAIVRIVIVLITLLTQGLGLIAYIVGVLVVPQDEAHDGTSGDVPSSAVAEGRDASFWAGVALLVVGTVWLFSGPLAPGRLLSGFVGGDVLIALLLIAFGLALWRSGERRDVPAAPSAPGVPASPGMSTPSAPTGVSTMADSNTADANPPAGDPASPPEQQEWEPPPLPSRERSLLGRITFGALLVVVGILMLLRTSGAVAIAAGQIVAAALLVVGLGLLVGAFVGRARWLVIVGLVLLPVVLAAELLRPVSASVLPELELRDGGGDVTHAPQSVDELQDEYRLGGGRLVVDLREVDVDAASDITIQLGAGELIVWLPDDVEANVEARVGVGELVVEELSSGGFGLRRSTVVVTGDGTTQLSLDVRVGVGQLDVRSSDSQ